MVIGILVLASLGLVIFSWSGSKTKTQTVAKPKQVATTTPAVTKPQPPAVDDVTLDNDVLIIDDQVKSLDGNYSDINAGLSDTSSI